VTDDGRNDFDFLHGSWRVHNRSRRLSGDWLEFDAEGETRPIVGGLGNVDIGRFAAPEPFEALALRLFDPATRLWRIWWSTDKRPGVLEPPVIGRFTDGRGEFHNDEVIDGEVVQVRYLWLDITASSARWEQAFSCDAGRTWETNWVMSLTH
jgi:hypothetical protein